MKDPITQGCLPALWAATAKEVKEQAVTGKYIVPPANVTEPSAQARDRTLEDNLWALSEKLLDEKLPGKIEINEINEINKSKEQGEKGKQGKQGEEEEAWQERCGGRSC